MFVLGIVSGLCIGAFLWRKASRRTSSWTSYVNVDNRSLNTIGMNGSRIILNGEEYVNVISLTIETKLERKSLGEKYVNMVMQLTGDVKGPLTLPSGRVAVQGNCAGVQTHAGGISVTGNCGAITSTTGTVSVGGDCAGSIQTSVGSVTVRGNCSGNIRTTVGSVTRG